MRKFTPDTKCMFECTECNIKETVKLKDFPTTPKGFFILPITVQCINCLRVIPAIIYEKP